MAINRRAFLSLVVTAPLVAALKSWQPPPCALPQLWGYFDIGGRILPPGFYVVYKRIEDLSAGTFEHHVRSPDGWRYSITTRDPWFDVGARFLQHADSDPIDWSRTPLNITLGVDRVDSPTVARVVNAAWP